MRLALVFVLLAGCGGSNACECKRAEIHVTITALDSTTRAPVGSPTFTASSDLGAVRAVCPDAVEPCPSWPLTFGALQSSALPDTPQTISVDAPGYAEGSVTFTFHAHALACNCTIADPVDETVMLTPGGG